MTIETIKDVLSRILTINKNLTSESLRTLLDASGWDSNDIKEGMRIYSDYVSAGNDMTKVSLQRPLQETNQIQNEAISIIPKIESKEDDNKKSEEIKTTNTTGAFNLSNIIDLTKDKQEQASILIERAQMLDLKKQEPVPVPQNIMTSTDVYSNTHKITLEEEVHEIDEYIHEKPWGLIIFNVVLFIITFSLLVYIVIN